MLPSIVESSRPDNASHLRSIRSYWTRTGQRTRLTEALLPLVGSVRGRVIDIGGGRSAAHDGALSPLAHRTRVDLSIVHRPDVQANAIRLPFKDGSADSIFLIEVLEHVPDPRTVVEEAARVLRTGGRLIGSVPFIAPIHGDPNDYFRYSDEGLRALLGGFDTVRIRPLGNAWSAAWALLAARSKVLKLANPVFRNLGTKADELCPQGYLFEAWRAGQG